MEVEGCAERPMFTCNAAVPVSQCTVATEVGASKVFQHLCQHKLWDGVYTPFEPTVVLTHISMTSVSGCACLVCGSVGCSPLTDCIAEVKPDIFCILHSIHFHLA